MSCPSDRDTSTSGIADALVSPPSTGDQRATITPGNYRIVAKLGEGGMGVVYLAEHAVIGRRVAIKLLHPELSCNTEMVGRFFNEARATSIIEHPGLISTFDFGHHPNGSAFLAMELLQGESLAVRRARERVPHSFAVAVVRQIASAVGAAHQAGVVHRDLKPDNVFLVPAEEVPCGFRVKVLDFGIAKLVGKGADPLMRTSTGLLMGTPAYMAPEQCRGAGKVDHRADIYSLGCILYEMMCGRPPFSYEGPGEIISAHLTEAPLSPRSFDPTIPPELEAVIVRALAKPPEERQQTMRELIEELDAAAGSVAGSEHLRTPVAGVPVVGTPAVAALAPPVPVAETPASVGRGEVASRPAGSGSSSMMMGTTLGMSATEIRAALRTRLVKRSLYAAVAGIGLTIALVAYVSRESGTKTEDSVAAGRATFGAGVGVGVGGAGVGAGGDTSARQSLPDGGARGTRLPPAGMVAIPGGRLRQGRMPYRRGVALDTPVHEVDVAPFAIGATEVTVGEYRELVATGRAVAPWPDAADLTAMARLPVVQVRYEDAEAYCQWRYPGMGRLPTESEWEWAARGATGRLYPWGSDFRQECVNGLHGDSGALVLVGKHECGATPEGLQDMAGNVWEWTSTRAAAYPGSPVRVGGDTLWVIRGGSFYNTDKDELTATVRQFGEVPTAYLGFRCAATWK
ncbi:MAG: bifunctional serine/threonine-protein kinase/formylglycine-generating enzyme family protein [Pseudomonadota bacterium]